jgi:hypothetical protein
MPEPKLITIRPHVSTEVLKLGLEVLALRKFPARQAVIARELERRKYERKAA